MEHVLRVVPVWYEEPSDNSGCLIFEILDPNADHQKAFDQLQEAMLAWMKEVVLPASDEKFVYASDPSHLCTEMSDEHLQRFGLRLLKDRDEPVHLLDLDFVPTSTDEFMSEDEAKTEEWRIQNGREDREV